MNCRRACWGWRLTGLQVKFRAEGPRQEAWKEETPKSPSPPTCEMSAALHLNPVLNLSYLYGNLHLQTRKGIPDNALRRVPLHLPHLRTPSEARVDLKSGLGATSRCMHLFFVSWLQTNTELSCGYLSTVPVRGVSHRLVLPRNV